MATSRRADARVDPMLRRELEEAVETHRPVQAVFFLRTGAEPPTAEQTRELVGRLLKAAERETAARPAAVNVFGNLASFVVEGPPALIESLLGHDEIRSARSNRAESPAMIPPRRRKGRG
jgi:hypothetical protein